MTAKRKRSRSAARPVTVTQVEPYSPETLAWYDWARRDTNYQAKLNRATRNPPYKAEEKRFVLEADGQRVSSGGYFPMELAVGDSTITSALIGWVETALPRQRRGYGGKLMAVLSKTIGEDGWNTSYLSASREGSRLYHQNGWYNVFDDVCATFGTQQLTGLDSAGCSVARFRQKEHLPRVAEIYDECFRGLTGIVVRDRKYWDYLLPLKTFFVNGGYDKDLFLVARRGRRIVAYAVGHRGDFHHVNDREVTVYEVGHLDGEAESCVDLLRRVGRLASASRIGKVHVAFPYGSQMMDITASLGADTRVGHWHPGHDMMKIHCLSGLLDEISGTLSARLKAGRLCDSECVLNIECRGRDDHTAALRIRKGKVTTASRAAGRNRLTFLDEEAMVQTVIGYRGLGEMQRRGRARASGRQAEELAGCLFPRTITWQSPLDCQ